MGASRNSFIGNMTFFILLILGHRFQSTETTSLAFLRIVLLVIDHAKAALKTFFLCYAATRFNKNKSENNKVKIYFLKKPIQFSF